MNKECWRELISHLESGADPIELGALALENEIGESCLANYKSTRFRRRSTGAKTVSDPARAGSCPHLPHQPLLLLRMKVMIQNPLTLSYLQAPGKWTSDINCALLFENTQSACRFCAEHDLYDLEVALEFPDHRHDVRIPVWTALPDNRQPASYERQQAIFAP